MSYLWLQIQTPKGKVLITNDGATILKQMEVIHPTARMVSSRNFILTALLSHLFSLNFSSLRFQKLKILRLVMEQPLLLLWLVPS